MRYCKKGHRLSVRSSPTKVGIGSDGEYKPRRAEGIICVSGSDDGDGEGDGDNERKEESTCPLTPWYKSKRRRKDIP